MEKKNDVADRHRAIERLAYSLWEQRRKPAGSSEIDWFEAERILRERESTPNVLLCGLVDFATNKRATSGWTYFVLPFAATPLFCERAARLLPRGLKRFCARDFEDSDADAFEQFLRLIRTTIDKHECSRLEIVANGDNWTKELVEESRRVVAAEFSGNGVTDQKIIAVVQKCAAPIFFLHKVLQNVRNEIELRLEIDRNSTAAPFGSLEMLIQLRTVRVALLLAKSFDACAMSRFPHSPKFKLEAAGIEILPSEKSWLLQASDVVGNFAAASAQVGTTSREYKRKAEIFQAVFGDVHCQEQAFRYQNGTRAHQPLDVLVTSDRQSNRI